MAGRSCLSRPARRVSELKGFLEDVGDRSMGHSEVFFMGIQRVASSSGLEYGGYFAHWNNGCRPRPRGAMPQGVEVLVAESTQPVEQMAVCYFIVSDDVERSRRFYTEVLGGTVVFGPEPTNVALANSFIVINAGGGPTDDKPTVTLETPSDPDRVSSFLNIRVTDIHAKYEEWRARGAEIPDAPQATRV